MTASTLDEQRAELSAEFPGWTIVYTRPAGRVRWWATRGLVRERMDERGGFTTWSAEDLRRRLRGAAGNRRPMSAR
ncbi:hypothetical protein [Actinomadura sp. NEAU-AAG7]|uniref:hypothetical protein n=1 Tax=Actinomadura sp. NEAU-AAG7 TaxID=2839640 RepID=UPI001BE4C900|nr:hypothetical protein [Actinomadura sp. NEAU-AAG7]MBT2211618.1 hypothetical protein [Actinomadura sp. NEAU-AAG7]